MGNKRTQRDRVLQYMQSFGSISTLEAFNDLGITRLSARIFELRRKGWLISNQRQTRKNRFGENCTYAIYRIIGKVEVNDETA